MKQKILRWLLRTILVLFGLSILIPILYIFLPVPFTPLMLQRCVEQAFDSERSVTFHKDWVPIEEISEHLVLAVVCSEDQKFEEHSGFDIEAIEKAIESNKRLKKKGKPIRGGSTISQQVAKNVFLFPSRTWIRKGFEVYFTVLIELFWSKERIMEVYLNVIEMGDGVYGAQAAAQDFFHKDASRLTPAEAATLAAVLPNPLKFSASKPSGYVSKRKNWILRQMNHFGGSIDLND